MHTHESLRQEIDSIDKEMMALFEKRMNVSLKVAEYKIENDIPIFDEVREKEVIKKNVARITDEELKEYGELFLNNLMGLSRRRQHALIDERGLPKNNI